jgi:DNA mismatch endonuclease, patch repair protein
VISARMSRVRRRSTTPELQVRRMLLAMGLRYRISNRDLPGSPDVANRAKKWAVFVHGCFWHRHAGCPRATTPRTNREFWLRKFAANRKRDERVQAELRKMGFKVAIVWECEALTNSSIGAALRMLKKT